MKVKILNIETLPGQVKRIRVEKPQGYEYNNGQYTLIGIGDEKKPFTITCPNDNDYLEFMIKKYENFTKKIHDLEIGDFIDIEDSKGKFEYSGPGIFLAAGVGITPYFSFLGEKDIRESTIIYSAKNKSDVIYEDRLKEIFGKKFVLTLTQEGDKKRIDEEFLKEKIENFEQRFYVCGPFSFVKGLKEILNKLGATEIITEF